MDKIFVVGAKGVVSREGVKCGLAPAGYRIEIAAIKDNNKTDALIGICGKSRDGWNDLDGEVPPGCGYWLGPEEAYRYLEMENNTQKYIRTDRSLEFKGKSLAGKKCKVLATIQDSDSVCIVEFEENIGGISCDGMGKRGHCLPVKMNFITDKKPEEKKNKERKLEESVWLDDDADFI